MKEEVKYSGDPALREIGISIMSERMNWRLVHPRTLTEEDKVIFNQAMEFMDQVQRGQEARRIGSFSFTARYDRQAAELARRTFAQMAKGGQPEQADPVKTVLDLQKTLGELAQGQTVDQEKLDNLQGFFDILLDITTDDTAARNERVLTGIS
jgi:hypothetical protein